jgi:5-methylcytosine-specific restriction protein A
MIARRAGEKEDAMHWLYGRRWREARDAYLRQNPIAVDIFGTHGEVKELATVVDHIVPHRNNLKLFWDPANWQGLTKADHDRKTALEDGGFGRPVKPIVTLICGPPGAGKSTWVNERRQPGDLVWDFDAVMVAIAGVDAHERSDRVTKLLPYLFAIRDAFYREVRTQRRGGRIWIIESCPTVAERRRFEREFGAQIAILATDEEECLKRVAGRGVGWEKPVRDWWARYRADQAKGAKG